MGFFVFMDLLCNENKLHVGSLMDYSNAEKTRNAYTYITVDDLKIETDKLEKRGKLKISWL